MEVASTKLTPIETLNSLAGIKGKLEYIILDGDILPETEESLNKMVIQLNEIINNQCNWFSMMNSNEI